MKHDLFLLQMAGTSGVGKSTLAGAIAVRTGAIVIDYDVIKSAALEAGTTWDMSGRVGYGASRAVAASLLEQGISVILDSPCRFEFIITEGAAVAARHGVTYAFIECVLTDENELRRRMQSRPRHRSQRIAFDKPPRDAPDDAMADASGYIILSETKYPSSPWLQVDTRQPVDLCLEHALAYLRSLGCNWRAPLNRRGQRI